jgi:hypothetical protein
MPPLAGFDLVPNPRQRQQPAALMDVLRALGQSTEAEGIPVSQPVRPYLSPQPGRRDAPSQVRRRSKATSDERSFLSSGSSVFCVMSAAIGAARS